MKIAILDSGVDLNHPAFNKKRVKIYSVDINNHKLLETTKEKPEFGHGTAIYGIISATVQNMEIVNIHISGIENGIKSEDLCETLEIVWKEEKPDIFNLSLGIVNCDDTTRLKKICDEIVTGGSIIVSAFDNAGAYSYPAMLENVIGVKSSEKCHNIHEIECYDDNIVNVGAYGALQRVAWCNPSYMICGGNSIACAHVTAEIANWIEKGGDKELLKKYFKQKTNRNININPKLEYKINRAAIFPFNKEMHSIVRFYSLLGFEITHIYAERRSMYMGMLVSKVIGFKSEPDWKIESISNIDWSDFDTLILGHTDKIENVNIHGIKNKLLENARKNKIKVFQFDGAREYNNTMFYSPTVRKEMLPWRRFGMLYGISCPVLGVYGTSSAQGKFSLQLTLRKKFQEEGYSIGQIGTEPHAQLFGIDYVFPIGYQNSVEFSGYDTIEYLNKLEHELCKKGVDLIITGSQSGSVSYDYVNLKYMNLRQYDFLLGTQPDAVILCINLYDEIEYIKRTISFIEASNQSHVIAMVALPLMREDNVWGAIGKKKIVGKKELEQKRKQLFEQIGQQLYYIGIEQEEDNLVESVIEYFGGNK